ncbi:MAG: NAD(P)/FAD-dependent oxidoreductase [Niabella sp.]
MGFQVSDRWQEMKHIDYDIGIVGGGLAGLTAAIRLKMKGYSVVLFEKNKYPFHRVCGEYISMESRNYLVGCGIDLGALHLPVIKKLLVSAPNGNVLKTELDPGGFGISRYTLDYLLYRQAVTIGVDIFEGGKVNDLFYKEGHYLIATNDTSCRVRLALGAFGKRSNMDVKWKRNFVLNKPGSLNNYIGIKYHINTDFPGDTIALHNFRNGYCGISRIEDNKYCLCYLTTAANLQVSNGIKSMESQILYQNKYLKEIFVNSDFLFDQPISISQVSFDNKEVVHNNIPLCGDACGMITPLCGNGMSIAMHGSKIFTELADTCLGGTISLTQMLDLYKKEWKRNFARRLSTGRFVQGNFGKAWQTNLFVGLMKNMPWLTKKIIRATHGVDFSENA